MTAIPLSRLAETLSLPAFLSPQNLQLSTLIRLCIAYPAIRDCAAELQHRIGQLAPDYPFDPADPIGSATRLAVYLLPRQPWTQEVEIGDELFYPVDELMFRAGLKGNRPLIDHLLNQGVAIEAALYGLLFGRHLELLKTLATDCSDNFNCTSFISLLNRHSKVLALIPEPYLNIDLLRLAGRKGYRAVIRYWFEQTPSPKNGLGIVASSAGWAGQNSFLDYLAGPPYWYIPNTVSAINIATGTGNTKMLDLLFPAGNVIKSNMLPSNIDSRGQAVINQYSLNQGFFISPSLGEDWIDPRILPLTAVEESLNKAIATGREALTNSHQQPRYALNLLVQASRLGNMEIVRQLLQNYCSRQPSVLAAALLQDNQSEELTLAQNNLLQIYDQLGLITPEVATTIIVFNKSQLNYLLEQPAIRQALVEHINKLIKYFFDNGNRLNAVLLLQQYSTVVDPDLIVHMMLGGEMDYLVSQGVRNLLILGHVIALLTNSKNNQYWTYMAT